MLNICMWMFQFLPESWITFVVYAVLGVGAVLYIMSKVWRWIPMLAQYNQVLEIAGIAVLVLGIYLLGGRAVESDWRERVSELETALAAAQSQSQQVNTVIEERVVTQTKVVREQGQRVIEYVDREVVKYDTKFVPGGQCEIPSEFVTAVNSAAERPAK